ncbi:serine/threonine-protein kinase [Oceanidesulfovibrio marinus]|uniref:Serine/threonine protein kinase n=1 Tax=Oceanidesulfovibrio marinus TaxID=370038 RepID=A0ABX6NFZ8_9BACT|nr:serine/threonine-protein kinase [Oceanidesulfovibrio marinus]QJT09502.1 serine/threonine protein kinase [Oceanidesulfovibrio marinus]
MNLPDRYESQGQVLSGGMGDVHVFRDRNLNRNVAIKIIQDDFFADRLLDEVRAFKRVLSKHVVEIYDIIQADDGVAIIEEYLPGEELRHPEEGLCREHFLRTIYQIASGLCEIHDSGLIHRDIKPFNMKFDGEGVLKIFDFGLARQFGVDSSTRGFRGTPGFAAPELYQDATFDFTPAIDVYAFGVTCLYYALGDLPEELTRFRSRDFQLTLFSNLTSNLLPRDLQSILDRTLEFYPSSRPSMLEVKNLIERHLLFNKHRALLILNGGSHFLGEDRPRVTVRAGSKGKIGIHYDGLYFKIQSFEGDVMINNTDAEEGMILPGACVISFGRPETEGRVHVTFDISHPGVVL